MRFFLYIIHIEISGLHYHKCTFLGLEDLVKLTRNVFSLANIFVFLTLYFCYFFHKLLLFVRKYMNDAHTERIQPRQ